MIFASGCKVTKTVRDKQPKPIVKKQEKPLVKNVVITPPKKVLTTEQKVYNYLRLFGPIAQREMKSYKIPASITLAQGLLESGFGEGRLAVEANNHFGIKCHRGWEGKRIYHDDDEKGECFRVYQDAGESYRDHSLFLTGRDRYAFLFRLGKKDYRSWARGLKKAGYATDPKYPAKLIRLIERFDLAKYDGKKEVVLPINAPVTNKKNNSRYIVQKGDTLYSIARKLAVDVKQLKQLNRLKDNTIYLGQELILPKK